jgi:prepilin-type processing-associated H-X9-DG protein
VNCLSTGSNGHRAAIYAEDSGGLFLASKSFSLVAVIPLPRWYRRLENRLQKVRVCTCPSYPDKKQLVCYVVNAWQFSGPLDTVGWEINGLTKVSRFQRPVDAIYFADNEYGVWRPIISDLGITISDELNDVWSVEHLPYAAGGVTLKPERRVAAARHGRGPNLLFFDGHSAFKKAKLITVDDWREQPR